MEAKELAKLIDHTILTPTARKEAVKAKCREAREYNFAAVVVNPIFIDLAVEELTGSPVQVGTVIGFPLGEATAETKRFAAQDAVDRGVDELDMVVNLGAVKSANWRVVREDIKAVVKAVDDQLVKVILETCYLTEAEKKQTCQTVQQTGADFIKTSTGFGAAGAQLDDISLFAELVGDDLGIKAAGGIDSRDQAIEMIEAGATRIGSSSGVQILTAG